MKNINKRIIKAFLFASLLGILLLGCQQVAQTELPPVPNVDISSDSLNKDLLLFFRKSYNTFKKGEDIVLDIHLKSDIQVKFDSTFEPKIYLLDKQNMKWVEIQDQLSYGNSLIPLLKEDIVLDTNNPNFTVTLHPLFEKQGQNDEATLLIRVTGIVLNHGIEAGQTTSYITLTLKP